MNKLILFFFLCNSMFSFAQSYEEKIFEKACECISKDTETENLNDLLQRCIISSIIELENTDPNIKENRQSTVEGMQKTFIDVSKLVIENCPALMTKVSEQKKSQFYKLSKNKKANEFFENGNNLRDTGNFELAIEQYKKAIKKDNDFVMAYDHIGVSYRKLNDFDNAIKYYNKSLKIFPEGEFTLLNVATIYSIMENELKAEEYYSQLIKFYPESPEGYYGLGKSSLILGRNETALRNALIAFIFYHNEGSRNLSDSETLLRIIYSKMKEDNELETFHQIAKEYNFEFDE